jgi:hypothetical protein
MSRLLGHGIDTLVVNFYWPEGAYQLPEGFPEKLDLLKDQFRVNPEAAIFWGIDAYLPIPNPALEGTLYEACLVRSTRHYPWQLSFGANALLISLSAVKESTQRRGFPAVRVEFTGRFMMYARRDAQSVVSWLLEALENLTGSRPERVQVSRADLFVDLEVEPGTFRVEDVDRFTSRSRVRGLYFLGGEAAGSAPAPAQEGGPMSNTPPAMRLGVPESWEEGPERVAAYLRGREWSGFTFGRGPLMARVYSKTLEAKSKPLTAILLRAYEDHHGPIAGHVVRVEFQLMPEVLSEMVVPGDGSDVRDWDTFLWAVPSIWAYLTRHWLVLRAREHGYSRMRDAPVDLLWVLVQEAFCEGGGTPVVREKRLGPVDVLALARQALGAFMTAKVVAGVTASFERVWQAFFRRLGVEDGAVVYRQVESKKLAKFGLMPEAYRFGGVPA